MKMSDNARDIMRWLASRYVEAGFPNHKVWNFSPAKDDTSFPELRALGLLRQMGTMGSPFCLTDAGHAWVMENRPDVATEPAKPEENAVDSSRKMFNLLVSGQAGVWEKPYYVLELERFLEHTDDDLRHALKALDAKVIAELTKIPSVFAYETRVDAPARVGWITNILRRQDEVRVDYRFDNKIEPLPPEKFESLKWELQIADWEMSRTHWAVKNVDLIAVLTRGPVVSAAVPPYAEPVAQPRAPLGDRVFIVHGRDNGAKHEVARFLQQIGVEPVILHERPNGGRTLIAKFQEESEGIQYAVVLMTPDDIGGLVGEASKSRARQNVIFELGFFIGKLGPSKVCALLSGDIEKPSDFDAVVYVPYGANTGWKTELARELRHAGVRFDANCIF